MRENVLRQLNEDEAHLDDHKSRCSRAFISIVRVAHAWCTPGLEVLEVLSDPTQIADLPRQPVVVLMIGYCVLAADPRWPPTSRPSPRYRQISAIFSWVCTEDYSTSATLHQTPPYVDYYQGYFGIPISNLKSSREGRIIHKHSKRKVLQSLAHSNNECFIFNFRKELSDSRRPSKSVSLMLSLKSLANMSVSVTSGKVHTVQNHQSHRLDIALHWRILLTELVTNFSESLLGLSMVFLRSKSFTTAGSS
ncbi:hypothetical protein J6590_017447 [Homalodisca vitripennis]|nr:hypothetical protein J6590_017447 [Homalodisca vitripennis]